MSTRDGKRIRFSDPMVLLCALPESIVAQHIYPFAVFVINDRTQLIEEVDRYMEDDDFRRICPIRHWDVERVTDFNGIFDAWRNPKMQMFNEDISSWNVSNGTTFRSMFYNCQLFNSDVSSWNVANAIDLSHMFYGCQLFNSDISSWNVTNVTDLSWTLDGCEAFNSDVSGWNVANVTDFSQMFSGCRSFHADVSNWNLANATEFTWMFAYCTSFDRAVVSGWPTYVVHQLFAPDDAEPGDQQ